MRSIWRGFWFWTQALLWLPVLCTLVWFTVFVPAPPVSPEAEAFSRAHEKHFVAAFLALWGCGYLVQMGLGNWQQKRLGEVEAQKRQSLRQQLRAENEAHYAQSIRSADEDTSCDNPRRTDRAVYYHVLIRTSSYPNRFSVGSLEQRDLSREEMIAKFIQPYLKNQTLHVGELSVPAPIFPKQKRQLFVFCTGAEDACTFTARIEQKHPEIAHDARVRNIELCCDDIFNKLTMETQSRLAIP